MIRKTSIRIILALVTLTIGTLTVRAQTQIKLPKNNYSPQQDVELGRKAVQEVRKEYPIINDEVISGYLKKLGDRLVAVAPPELNQPVYEYSFTPVNVKEINAFALPGGPMFVNRGMFDAASEEGEVVGVMAHELSHVLLRHGTANMTKANNPWLQLGQIAGVVGGAMVGGAAGSAIGQGSQVALGSILLRYSRDFEKQADLLGAQMMARAGYDPRSLAHMFETIEKQSKGGSGPQWMSSHPNPGNRTVYITQEAQKLTLGEPADTSGFAGIKKAFAALPTPGKKGAMGDSTESVGTPGQPVPPPSTNYRTVGGGGIFQASLPSNWASVGSDDSIKFVPENGYGPLNGETVFTHGVEFGVTKASSRDLRTATKAFIDSVSQSNPKMKISGEQQNVSLSQRPGLSTPLSNESPLGGEEWVTLYTTFLANGNLFYYVTVVPAKDAKAYEVPFGRIPGTLKLTDKR
jgi:Zn-dependent protease with chaperone function